MDFKWDPGRSITNRFAKGRRLNLKPFKEIVGRSPLLEISSFVQKRKINKWKGNENPSNFQMGKRSSGRMKVQMAGQVCTPHLHCSSPKKCPLSEYSSIARKSVICLSKGISEEPSSPIRNPLCTSLCCRWQLWQSAVHGGIMLLRYSTRRTDSWDQDI